jgi:hypothetical protein
MLSGCSILVMPPIMITHCISVATSMLSHFLWHGPGSCLKPTWVTCTTLHLVVETVQIYSVFTKIFSSPSTLLVPYYNSPRELLLCHHLPFLYHMREQLLSISCSVLFLGPCSFKLHSSFASRINLDSGKSKNVGFWLAFQICPSLYWYRFLIGIKVFNSLPQSLKKATGNIKQFKTALKR